MTKRSISIEVEEAIVRTYQSGLGSVRTAKAVGCCPSTVKNVLHRRGLGTRQHYLTEEEKALALNLYRSGAGCPDIAKRIGCGSTQLYAILESNGVPRRTSHTLNRRHWFNERFFEIIDTEEKAYWLGFLNADVGYSLAGRITLTLKGTDKAHVEKFKLAIETDSPVVTRYVSYGSSGAKSQVASLVIHSVTMLKDLKSHGVVAPSLERTVSPHLPAEHFRHFFRGLVDGDGCISRQSCRKGYATDQWSVGCCGSAQCVAAFAAFAKNVTGTRAGVSIRPCRSGLPLASFVIGGLNQTQRLVRALYSNAAVYLDRKMKLAKTILETPIRRASPKRA